MNLLAETQERIKESGHSIVDIVFIGSEESGHSCSWDEFKVLADQEYDEGFGAQEVATDLVIVFMDGVKMRRYEYDGFERWTFSRPFKNPDNLIHIATLFTKEVGWDSLKDMNS